MQYLIIIIALFILELIYFRVADKFNIIDKPNERSSHTQVTLRGGGVIFYFGILIYFIMSGFQYPYFFIGLTAIALISFLDDILTLSSKLRMIIQVLSVLLMLFQVGVFDLSWWIILIALIISVGVINAYNFMDGINGITVSNSIAVLVLLGIVNLNLHFVDQDVIYISIFASLVFGFFNFRNKAKCFAGDVGSVAMAFIILFLLAKLILQTQNIIYILFLLLYGLDTVWTIIKRLRNKENIFEAHRSHLYQIFANENKTNRLLISGVYGIIQLIVGGIIILVSKESINCQLTVGIGLIVFGSVIYLYVKSIMVKKHHIDSNS